MAMDSRKMFNRYILGFEFIFGHSNIKNLNFFAAFYRLSICVFKYQKKKKFVRHYVPQFAFVQHISLKSISRSLLKPFWADYLFSSKI